MPLMLVFIGPCFFNGVLLVCTLIYDKTSIYTLVIVGDFIAGLTGGSMTELSMQMTMVTDKAREKVYLFTRNVLVTHNFVQVVNNLVV